MKRLRSLLGGVPASAATLAVVVAGVAYFGAAVIPDAVSTAQPESCTPDPRPGHGYVAVFGRFTSLARAQVLMRAAQQRGFGAVKVVRPTCQAYVAELTDIPDATVGESFRKEAASAGFRVDIVPG